MSVEAPTSTQEIALTSEVVAFVRGSQLSDVSERAMHAAKRSLLDGLGLAVAGSRTGCSRIAQRMIATYGCSGTESSVLGTNVKLPARFAAFLNGVAIHADDYDDRNSRWPRTGSTVSSRTRPHRSWAPRLPSPNGPMCPAPTSSSDTWSESRSRRRRPRLSTRVTMTRDSTRPRHWARSALGAGAARLLGLDEKATARAIGIAASQAGGVREHFGTTTKPFHAGRAAESGVVAAELAALGFSAAENALEAPRGFFSAAGGGYDSSAIHGRMGNPWTFEFPGVSIKPHPSGSLTHLE